MNFRELLEKDAKLCHQIRGTQMIVVMKLISLGFDLDAGKFTQSNQRNQHVTVTTPNIIETMGYVMCPANCILGPWVSYTDYNAIYQSSTGKWVYIFFNLLQKMDMNSFFFSDGYISIGY